MAVLSPTVYRNTTGVYPRADVLLHKKKVIVFTTQRSDTLRAYFVSNSDALLEYEAIKDRKMGKVGVFFSKTLPSNIHSSALKVRGFLQPFVKAEALQGLSTFGSAIGSGFNKGIEEVFGAKRADFELMATATCARWINNSLVNDLVDSYRATGLPIDNIDGIEDFWDPITLDIQKDPVRTPTAPDHVLFERAPLVQHLKKVNQARPDVELRIQPLEADIERLQGMAGDHTAEIAALRKKINEIGHIVCPLHTGFYREKDLIGASLDSDSDSDRMVNFLNTAIANQNLPPLSPEELDHGAKYLEASFKAEVSQVIEDEKRRLTELGVPRQQIQTLLRNLQAQCDQSLERALTVQMLPLLTSQTTGTLL